MKPNIRGVLLLFTIFIGLTPSFSMVRAQFQSPTVINDDKNVPMVFVPGGTFHSGQPFDNAISLCQELVPQNEQDVCNEQAIMQSLQNEQEITVSSFYLDQFEVSVESYTECFDADVCTFGPLYFQEQYGWIDDGNLPIARASYYDAAIYCAWRGARLPIDYEWEYAARGPEEFTFPWGDAFDGSAANYCDRSCDIGIDTSSYEDDGYAELAPVTTYEHGQSWVGAYNLAGNVQEWTSTSRNSEYSEAGYDKVAKGGNFRANPYQVASWTGFWLEAEIDLTGFRCARTPDQTLRIPNTEAN